jgi:hypothetical protein
VKLFEAASTSTMRAFGAIARGLAWLEQQRAEMCSAAFQCLYQGNPVAYEGGLFRRHWWKNYTVVPVAEMGRGSHSDALPSSALHPGFARIALAVRFISKLEERDTYDIGGAK